MKASDVKKDLYEVYCQCRDLYGKRKLSFRRFNRKMWELTEEHTGEDGKIDPEQLKAALEKLADLP